MGAKPINTITLNQWVPGSSPGGCTSASVLLRVPLDTFSRVKEISVMEQRYQAVLAVIADGRGEGEVAAQFGVSRQSVHAWLRRYEDHGLEGLANRSHKPK